MTTPHTDGIGHDDTEDLASVLADLRDEVRGLRHDVQQERRGRSLTQRLAALVVVVAFIGGAGWIIDTRAAVNRREAERCSTRHESRQEIRAMGVALTSYVIDVAGVDPEQAAEILAGAEQVALDTLPPPDC